MTKNRIAFTVPDELREELSKIPWGVRSQIIRSLLVRVLEVAEAKGAGVYTAICAGQFQIEFKAINDD